MVYSDVFSGHLLCLDYQIGLDVHVCLDVETAEVKAQASADDAEEAVEAATDIVHQALHGMF